MQLDALKAHHLFNRETHGDGAIMANGDFNLFDGLEPKTGAILERAAIYIGPLIGERREELGRQNAVRAVDIDNIKARLHRPLGRLDIHLLKIEDVLFVGLVRVT